MKTFNYLKNNYIILIILISTILLILPKWILSFTFFDENIILRIINDVTDEFYFPIIKSFSDLICFIKLFFIIFSFVNSSLFTFSSIV